MSIKTMGPKVISALALLGLLAGSAHAYAPHPELLDIMGFSPQTVEVIETQTYRDEWKQPPPRKRTVEQQLYRNIWINDWTGSLDPFGSGIIRERQ